MAFFWATGSMYMLCDSCSPSELYTCPETHEKTSENGIAQYFCGLCQDWHVGIESDDPKAQIEECDLPWDEPPPICIRAVEYKANLKKKTNNRPCLLRRSEPQSPNEQIGDVAPRSEVRLEQSSMTTSFMTLRDTVLGIAGQIDGVSCRLARLENGKKSHTLGPPTTESQKTIGTQTETESDRHPPASEEALILWKKFQNSKKSDTEILIETLKSLNLEKIFVAQNEQISRQTTMLNNLNRTVAQLSKPNQNQNQKFENKKRTQNGSSKRQQRE